MPQFNSFVYDTSAAYTPDIIRGDCYAIFRLSPEYKKKGAPFGFDWVRSGDALDYVAHDIPYEGNVGRNFKGMISFPERPDDTDITFREMDQMYDSLCRSYLPGNITIFPSITGKTERYHTPVLSIYPKDIMPEPAKLVLELNILKKPKSIHLGYDKTLLEIQGAESLPCEPGKHTCEIEILCIGEIKREIYIYTLIEEDRGEEKLAGIMRVWRNDKAFRKKISTLLVNVKFLESDEEDASAFTGNPDIIKESLNKYLSHAIIRPNIKEVECDLGFDLELRKRILRNDGQMSIITYEETDSNDSGDYGPGCIEPLDQFFEKILRNSHINTSDYHIIIISLGAQLCMLTMDGGIVSQGGYSFQKYIFVENESRKIVPVHECLHVLGLNHTFNNMHTNGKLTDYTYKVGITDNLMDYSHLFGVNAVNWWEWQWKFARVNASPEE